MNNSRLALLADRHAQTRKIVFRSEDESGNYYSLECGHEITHAPHFALSKQETMQCRKCGEAFVRTSPQYAKEFERKHGS